MHDPDHALVAACQRGHAPSCGDPFRLLHDRHKDVVHRICLRITGDASEALDAAQDAFLLAFRGIPGFRFGSRFSGWLFQIAVRASFERLRRRRPPCPFSELEALEFECLRSAHPPTFAAKQERSARVRLAIRGLSPRQREIIGLRYFEGLSYGEVACRLAIPGGSVRSRLHRAHAALSRGLRSLEGELAAEA